MNTNFPHAAVSMALLVGALIAFAILLMPGVFYILTLQKALNRCAPESRAMEPAMVWLLLVPCFNVIWDFFVVINMSKSLAAEFQRRGMSEDPEPGKKLGLIMCILACCLPIPFLGFACFLGCLVCWIMYWIKIAGYSKKLEA